jgi:hypothetical protein
MWCGKQPFSQQNFVLHTKDTKSTRTGTAKGNERGPTIANGAQSAQSATHVQEVVQEAIDIL